MATTVDTQLQETDEISNRSIKHKQTGNSVFKFIITLLIVGVAIAIASVYGDTIVEIFTNDDVYSPNQVELIQHQTQQIAASLKEQRQAIHSLEIRMVDQRIVNEDRFAELEAKITKLEADINQLHVANQQTHVVKRGETLWRISMKYYGSGQYIQALAKYNNIINPRHIVSGSKIVIPPVMALQ